MECCVVRIRTFWSMLAHEYLHPLSTNHATVSGDRQSNNARVGERTRYSRAQNHVYARIQVLITLRKPRLGIDLRLHRTSFWSNSLRITHYKVTIDGIIVIVTSKRFQFTRGCLVNYHPGRIGSRMCTKVKRTMPIMLQDDRL